MQWEATVAPPHGRTELERLVDIDSAVIVSGQDVYAVGFQGKVAMLALDTGQVWWSHDASSYRSMGIDDDAVHGRPPTARSLHCAPHRRRVWRQKALLYRGLSAPAVWTTPSWSPTSRATCTGSTSPPGRSLRAHRSGKVRISNAPVVAGNMLVVINDRGRINAYRVTPLPGAPSGAAPLPVHRAAAERRAAAATTEARQHPRRSDAAAGPARPHR